MDVQRASHCCEAHHEACVRPSATGVKRHKVRTQRSKHQSALVNACGALVGASTPLAHAGPADERRRFLEKSPTKSGARRRSTVFAECTVQQCTVQVPRPWNLVMRALGMSRASLTPPQSSVKARARRRCAAQCAPHAGEDVTTEVFARLLEASGAESCTALGRGEHGLSLFARRDVAAGETLLRVPVSACLVFTRCPDTRRTLSWRSPDAGWPRTLAALEQHDEEGLPWDVLAAVSVLDVLSGDGGGPFWSAYASLMPRREALTLPLVASHAALAALRDPLVQGNARLQRERLAGLLPALAQQGEPSLATAFAVVRSRAFTLAPDCFAMVPFADLANHAGQPSAEVLQPSEQEQSVRIVAKRDVRLGEEVTLSYSGDDAAYTNARFMAQHGFVPAGGNRADRVALTDDVDPSELSVQPLSLAWMQDCLGDQGWLDMLFGSHERDARTYAALSSLPTSNDDAEPQRDVQLAAAAALRERAAAALTVYGDCTLEEMAAQEAAAHQQGDLQLAAATRYALERRLLWLRVHSLLSDYEQAVAQREI